MKHLTVLLVLFLVGCTQEADTVHGIYSLNRGEVCIKGVVYYVTGNRIEAPAFKPDGTLYTCESPKTY